MARARDMVNVLGISFGTTARGRSFRLQQYSCFVQGIQA
jgi:hypothetical protein